MQDVDGVADIKALAAPRRPASLGIDGESRRLRLSPEPLVRIRRHDRRGWDLPKWEAVGPEKSQLTVGLTLDPEALLVDRTVVIATEQGEVRQGGGPSVRPVADVMALGESGAAAGEAAATVAVVESAAQCGRDGAGPGPDLDDVTVGLVAHDHATGVAGQTLGRFRGNARAVLVGCTPKVRHGN